MGVLSVSTVNPFMDTLTVNSVQSRWNRVTLAIGLYWKGSENERERSEWTVLIYLNGNFRGGGTELFGHGVIIQPEPGLLLAFRHRQPHASAALIEGTKYVLRSDVMYCDTST